MLFRSRSIISKTDINGVITYVNEPFEKISGYKKEEILGKSHNIVSHPNMDKTIFIDMWKKIKIEKKSWQGRVKNLSKNGNEYFVDLINQGVRGIKPNLDLILRHTSGSLFQEAHREVIYFNPQRDLFGGVSSKLETRADAYSSIHYTPQYI